jgi:hypothetical protein
VLETAPGTPGPALLRRVVFAAMPICTACEL